MQVISKAYQYDEFTPCLYDTERDLIDRLHETVVRKKGDPNPRKFHYLNNKKCSLVHPITGAEETVLLSEIDISSIELGYMNYTDANGKKKVVYLYRDVRKQYRQGLSNSNVASVPSEFSKNYHFTHQQGFIDLCLGIYPSYEAAVSELKEEGEGERAISPDIKIRREYSGILMVYHRLKNVGWIQPGKSKVNVMATNLDWTIRRALQRYGIEMEA